MKDGYMFLLTILSMCLFIWLITLMVSINADGGAIWLAGFIMFIGLLVANIAGWNEVD